MSRRQLEVLRVFVIAGSAASAAHALGIGDTSVRQHLSGLYRHTGCLNAAQAAYWLRRGDLAAARHSRTTTPASMARPPIPTLPVGAV